MKKLLNTLYVTSEDAYLSLDGENIVVKKGECEVARFPLHTLEGVVAFCYAGASPALMGACAERQIALAFYTPRGKFLARTCGKSNGNVLLRRTQYRVADDEQKSLEISNLSIFAKIYNGRWIIERTIRDHALRVDTQMLKKISTMLKELSQDALNAQNMFSLRGTEGVCASLYFDVFDELILANKEDFFFTGRNRRPPLDNVNALLSFSYSILARECSSALEGVGLDSFVGFLHRDRSGRASLALDLMEELRPCMADRFVLTLINNRILTKRDFVTRSSGAVELTDEGRKKFFAQWQKKKQETITHPFLEEKISWGLVPHVQSLLLSRYLRGDLDAYPPFLWK